MLSRFKIKAMPRLLPDEQLVDTKLFLNTLDKVYANRQSYEQNMRKAKLVATNNKDLVKKIMSYCKYTEG